MSPRLSDEPVVDASSANIIPTSFTVGTTTLPTSSRARATGKRRRRGTWFSLSANKLISTSHFVAVPINRTSVSVAVVPGKICHLIEVVDQFGNFVRASPPCIIRWPAGVLCRIRELRPSCVSVALHRGKRLPKNIAIVRVPAGILNLGRVGNLMCAKCRIGFTSQKEALHHFKLPELEVRQTINGGTMPYQEPRHGKEFQMYLDACKKNPTRMPTELLPQLNGNELRRKLEAIVANKNAK